MFLHEFVAKYGTDTVSMLMRNLAARVELSPFAAKEYAQIATDLEDALRNYAKARNDSK